MNAFINRVRHVKLADILQGWKLIVSIIPALIYRIFENDLWIVCEDPNEARDNGYWMFKYIKEHHPEQKCIYAIKSSSPDYKKVVELGETVEYGSLKHWILYLASSKKISSQKAGNPNAPIFFVLEVYGFLKNKRIFLQHGITINDGKWLYYNVTKIRMFICGAYPEYEYILQKFGYPKENVFYTGFCRFDGLHNYSKSENIILIMPTWREWIQPGDYRLKKYEGTTVVQNTNYFMTWTDFIKDRRIKIFAEKYGVKFIFFPHRNMQKYLQYFPLSNEYIKIASANQFDVQDLMKRASLMITDYSSVSFDMIYMKKPVIYYQFDYQQYRDCQYAEGYFNYKNNPFARSFKNKEKIFYELEKYIKNNFSVSGKYIKSHKEYFKIYDSKNCERIYNVIKEI
ncbi:CDP-glycerol glycerophosphotransferase family protein [uncultured Phascolarctobacterium sp.]|uniref:CDP-glycerol glycerophosphotransferase family protein n=1 Tax=uncultured Phascolarctobacterium sp. TaxID=512296 RepID=UPI0025EF62D6|nr:CDP-glycerol glycerophosphotransferase family protein [uncultured Phascolarctobacterium sp.]